MNLSILKIFTVFGIVSTWAEKALKDGKVTLPEAVDLSERLAGVLGIQAELEFPALDVAPPEKVEEANKGPNTEGSETTEAPIAAPPWVRS